MTQVTWKGRLRVAYPDASAYSTFLGNFSTATGAVTILMMFTSRIILNNFGCVVEYQLRPSSLGGYGCSKSCLARYLHTSNIGVFAILVLALAGASQR